MSWMFCAYVKTDALEKWVKGEPVRYRDQSRGGLQVGQQRYGKPRVSMDTVYSYSVAIGVRLVRPDGRVWFLLNGDAAGGSVTAKHQRELRSAVDSYVARQRLGTKGRCIVPFSAIRAAGLKPADLDLLDTTGDLQVTRTVSREVKGYWARAGSNQPEWVPFDTPRVESHDYTTHTLGSSLFAATRREAVFVPDPDGTAVRYTRDGQAIRGRHEERVLREYYVSGVDDTAAGRGVGYFLTRLRARPFAPKTVAQAFSWMRPLVVRRAMSYGTDVVRQGDQFLIPLDSPAISARQRQPLDSAGRRTSSLPNTHGEPSRHSASTSYPVIGGTAVTGRISHEAGDHRPVFCRGRWFLAVPNVQDRSWGASGRVD